MVFNASFNNISVISWTSILLVEQTRVQRESHRPAASHWQTRVQRESHRPAASHWQTRVQRESHRPAASHWQTRVQRESHRPAASHWQTRVQRESHIPAASHWQTRVQRESHRPAASHWQTLSHKVVSSTCHEWHSNSTLVVIGTVCISSCKSNYHTITTTTVAFSI